MNVIAMATSAAQGASDNSWVAIWVSVLALLGTIAGTVLAPWMRERSERKARSEAERRSEIRRLVNEALSVGAAYQLAYTRGNAKVITGHFIDFVRAISALDMWLTSEEQPVAEMLRMVMKEPETNAAAGQGLAYCGLVISEWFRGDISPREARAKYEVLMIAAKAKP